MSMNKNKKMIITLVAFLLVSSFNCESSTCKQFFQNGTETVQGDTVDCKDENSTCIRMEGENLILKNGTEYDKFSYGACVKTTGCENCFAIHESNLFFTEDSEIRHIEVAKCTCCDNENDCNTKGIPDNATAEKYLSPPKKEPVPPKKRTDTVKNSPQPSNKINTTIKITTTTKNSKAPKKSATQEPVIKEKEQKSKIANNRKYEQLKEVEKPVPSAKEIDTVKNSGQPSKKATKTTTTTKNSKAPKKSVIIQEPAIKEKKQGPKTTNNRKHEQLKEVEKPVPSAKEIDTVKNSGQPSKKATTTIKTTTTTKKSKATKKSATKEKKQGPKIADQTAGNQKSSGESKFASFVVSLVASLFALLPVIALR